MSEQPIRYSKITEKNPREILMLRGRGCAWKRCAFCDYHLDCSSDEEANYQINLPEIEKVTGIYQKLEVINSGSFYELDSKTLSAIREKCIERSISVIHFETHWMYRKKIQALRDYFGQAGITVKMKIGVETFDQEYREKVPCKGMPGASPEAIASYCDEACLLFGLTGQTKASMQEDIETGLAHFERICINIMNPNTSSLQPDPAVIEEFLTHLYPLYQNNERIDILLENTEFGVGGTSHA